MIDWTQSMQRTFEYYTVDPNTWKDATRITNVISSNINRDKSAGTLGSASISVTESLGECYIRIYLIAVQNGITEKIPMGTYLVQTPSSSFDGKIRNVTMDAYTPLIELKEKNPPIGYSLLKGDNVMEQAYLVTRENLRAPVVQTTSDKKLFYDFVAQIEDTWLTYITDLLAYDKKEFDIDEMGRILFAPVQNLVSLQPVWTYTDDNSSILQPAVNINHDIYGIPNVVEVIYSNGEDFHYSRVVNDDENSPLSTVRRGREIVHRVTSPDLTGDPTQDQIEEYARQLLETLSSVEYTVTYTHAYCPVRLGDCVRLNYKRAGLKDIKAKVISQSISCTPDCQVTETAVFTTKLWGGVL